jgi:hypothetical protein
MNAPTAKAVIPTESGTPFEGGFFVGRFRLDGAIWAAIVSPMDGDLEGQWLGEYLDVPAAHTFNDGHQNTMAMATAGSELAKAIQVLSIGGFEDWYLPARDELELLYRHLKPTTETNYTWRNGENPSAIPATYAYEELLPVQTSATGFQEGGEHALSAQAYWSSTQSSRHPAWFQHFAGGSQYYHDKSAKLRARAFRRFKIE